MPSPAKLCVYCGVLDIEVDHRDEDGYEKRCPDAEQLEHFEPVHLREL